MQTTASSNTSSMTTAMDIQSMQQPMDWLFKKERIYMLAQFWQQRATQAEQELSTLKEKVSLGSVDDATVSDSKSNDLGTLSPKENKLANKDKEICQLVEDVHKLQSSMGHLKESTASQICRLEEELQHRRQQIMRLEAKLEAQRDYDDVKRQLSILRAIKNEGNYSGSANAIASVDLKEAKEDDETVKSTIDPTRKDDGNSEEPTKNSGTADSAVDVSPETTATTAASAMYGSLLGHEMVANWRRNVEQSAAPSMSSHSESVSPCSEGGRTSRHNEFEEGSKMPSRNESSLHDSRRSSISPRPSTPKSTRSNSPCHEHHSSASCKSPASDRDLRDSPHFPNPFAATHHNNNIPPGLINGLCGLNMNLNNNLPLGFDMLKSQFRFDDHRPPYDPSAVVGRFGESLIPKGDPMEARLQEMLRYNMDKYSNSNLDTLHIARRVRELLSIHNVGQRLFAKYVLGLSQGTVSELLSKPKPWDKLTEKGRDSYRKMHAWACDENAIMLLKSLIPKKGKESGLGGGTMPSIFGRSGGDTPDMMVGNASEDRITHILTEASHMMTSSHSDSMDQRSNDGVRSPSHVAESPSPVMLSRKAKKYDYEDMSQEQLIRIYREELAKMMGRRFDENAYPGFVFPPFFGAANANPTNQEELRLALESYHREISNLQNSCPGANVSTILAMQQQAAMQHQVMQQQVIKNGLTPSTIQDLTVPKQERPKSAEPKVESARSPEKTPEKKEISQKSPYSESAADPVKQSGSAFSLVRPPIKQEAGSALSLSNASATSSPLSNSILTPEDFSPSTSVSVSPLQRMASITNSLLTTPPVTHQHSPSQRPLKAVLPPITQQQFDQFNNLNTEDIVRKVKEQLSQFSISQRLFGESVLGLSQGSVSDLLARPKPWHMLTQKGREPFIRMKMFLEDENAVHKLVASQYKIAPEKLMRTGGYGGPPPISPLNLGNKTHPSAVNNLKIATSAEQYTKSSPSAESMERANAFYHNYMHRTSPQVNSSLPSPIFTTATHTLEQAAKKFTTAIREQACKPATPQFNTFRNIGQHISPSVYEMAALTQELDTQVITTKIKEVLLANNIGQKIFGEVVLGLSQGSVSELLSKPKPWHMLSIKGREPFIRMQLWLTDSANVERLQSLKSERRELSKRRRGSGQDNNSSDTSSNENDYYGSASGSPHSVPKKARALFSDEQKEALRVAFALDTYPNVATVDFLANELGLEQRSITNWFHNHRMRLKLSQNSSDSRDLPCGGFDPVRFRLLLSQRLGFSPMSLPFANPYFNPEFAALVSRNMSSTEPMSGLDLSLKRESGASSDEDMDSDDDDLMPIEVTPSIIESRSSRRKPAAPQWVNPDWQEPDPDHLRSSNVVINGVCVMQTDEFERSDSQHDEEDVSQDEKNHLQDTHVADPISPHIKTETEDHADVSMGDGEEANRNASLTIKNEVNWEEDY